MKDSTVLRLSLGLLVLLVGLVARGAWVLSEMSFKVDTMWQERRHVVTAAPRDPFATINHQEPHP